jgi:hypothetical protein
MSAFHPRIIATVVLGLSGSLLLAGCSIGSPSTPIAADPSGSAAPSASASPSGHTGAVAACSLITEQEASTALGADPGPGAADARGIATSCTFGSPPSLLRVDLVPADGKAGYAHALDLAKSNSVVTINGVGDEAFGTFNNAIGAIEFSKGDAVVIVVLAPLDASKASQNKMTVLATLAAGRL